MISRRTRAAVAPPVLAGILAAGALCSPRGTAASPRLTVGVEAGVLGLDGDLARYRWDVTPRPVWGGIARLGMGRWDAGLRLREWRTEQSLDGSGDETVDVNGLAVEATARFRAASALGIGVFPSAGVGRIYLGYEPERVTVQLDPGSPPLAVTFSPIDEWLVSLGMALERPVVSRLLCSLAVEREFFALDTSHRNGAQIVEERESFGGWNVRLGLSWGWGG